MSSDLTDKLDPRRVSHVGRGWGKGGGDVKNPKIDAQNKTSTESSKVGL